MRFPVVKINTFLLVLLAFLFVNSAFGQNPVKWTLESDAKGKFLETNEKLKAKVKAEIEDGWHLYALDQPEGGPVATTIKIPDGEPFKIDGKIISSTPISKPDSNFLVDDKPLETKFFDKKAEFNLPLLTLTNVQMNDLTPAVNVRFQVCNDSVCLPPKTIKLTFSGFEDVKRSVVSSQSPVVSQNAANTSSTPK